MGTTYNEADRGVYAILDEVIAEHRPDLIRNDVKFYLKMALSEKEGVPAVKHNGWPAYAVIKVNPPKDRIEGKRDATITIDADKWEKLGPRARRALLHHEIHHVVPTGEVDSLRRPVLEVRKHDWQGGGFDEVLRLYGADSVESRFIDLVNARRDQQVFGFVDGADGDDDGESAEESEEPDDSGGITGVESVEITALRTGETVTLRADDFRRLGRAVGETLGDGPSAA